MKYIFYLLTIFLTQTSFASLTADKADYQLFEMQGKQGIKDAEGKVLIPAQYEVLGWSKGDFRIVNNVLGFSINGQWGIISLNNEVVSEPAYTQLYPTGKGYLIAAQEGKVSNRDFLGIVSIDGKTILPFKYSSIIVNDLRAVVSVKTGRDYKYGVVDLADRIIVPLEYKEIKLLGSLRYAVKNFDNKTAIYSDKGRQIVDFTLDSISNFNQNLAVIYDNHQRGLINAQGQIVEALDNKGFEIGSQGVKKLKFNEWSILNSSNELLGKHNYDNMRTYDSSRIQVWANGKSWLIDDQTNPLTPIHYTDLSSDNAGFIAYQHKGKWGVLQYGKEALIPAKFDSVFLRDDMIYVCEVINEKTRWSLYDTYGVKKSNHYYDNIRERTDYYFPVRRQGHWGFINRAGEEVIHCVYDDVSSFTKGMSVVKFHGETGIIDKFGDWVVLPQKGDVEIIDDRYYLTYQGKLTTLKSYEEGTVYFTENRIEVKDNYLLEHLSEGGLWKIDFEGRIFNSLGEDRYEEVRPPSEGFYAVKIDGKYGFIDAENRLRIANRYDEVGPFNEELAAFKLLGHWGFLDKRERIIIQPSYNYSSTFKHGIAIVADGNGSGLINKDGNPVCSFDYDRISRQDNDRFLVQKGGKYGLLSKTGKLLVNAKYDELRDLNNGFAIIKKFGKYGVINIHGVDVIPVMYDAISYDAAGNRYFAMKKSEWEAVSLQ